MAARIKTTRRKTPEQDIQRAVAQYLDAARTKEWFWFFVPNGGNLSKAQSGIFKACGLKPGIPDLVLLHKGRAWGIELKSPKGRLSVDQIRTHELLKMAGMTTMVAYSVGHVEACLEIFGIPSRIKRAS